jgi:hypothetical protein
MNELVSLSQFFIVVYVCAKLSENVFIISSVRVIMHFSENNYRVLELCVCVLACSCVH